MDDLRFYVPFNSISIISGQWEDDNERLCAKESHLQLERIPPPKWDSISRPEQATRAPGKD